MSNRVIYLDHGASTPVDPRVLEVMLPYWTEVYGNPSSQHTFGRSAAMALETARHRIAKIFNARPDEIVFTGSGSESDNLALRGVMWAARTVQSGNHLIVSAIEHKAILETAVQLRDLFNFDLTILPVDQNGRLRIADVEAAIRPETVLISIMAANNEVGTLQPIWQIGELARAHSILLHSDAVQAVATQSWDMSIMPIDLLSIAPHKFYGPKGIGILYVRQGTSIQPTQTGGGQENGRRSGTPNVPFAVGAAEALSLAMTSQTANIAHYTTLRDRLISGLGNAISAEDFCLTGHPTERLPHNASFAFRNINGNDLLMHLDIAGVAASSGSACSSGNPKPSEVLEALALDPAWTKGGLRLTVGKQNTLDDIDYVVSTLPTIVKKLQTLGSILSL